MANLIALASLVVSFVSACVAVLAIQASRAVEVDAIRLVKDGQIVWEVVARDDGGARMAFFDRATGKTVIAINGSGSLFELRAGSDKSQLCIHLKDDRYSETVLFDDMHIGFGRSIQRTDTGWSVERKMNAHGYGVFEDCSPGRTHVTWAAGASEFGVEASRQDVAIIAMSPNDVNMNVRLGSDGGDFKVFGSLKNGLAVSLNCLKRIWTWESK